MHIIIWKYKVKKEFRDQFIDYYKSGGEWVKFFQQDNNFIGTDFFQGTDANEFVTIDQWISREAFEDFKTNNHDQYYKIDKACETFTESEILVGTFFSVE